MEWVIKIIRLWPDFSEVAKHDLKGFLDEKVFLFAGSYRYYLFSIQKKSQNKLDLMQSYLLKRFTKLVNLNFRGCEAKKSHLSHFPFSFYLNLNQSTI